MNHRQINPDEAIDRLLAGLREAGPPDGMQQRVLRTAEERAGTRRRWSLRLPFTPKHSWAAATVAAVAVALAASWTIARNHRIAHDSTYSSAHLVPAGASGSETHFASGPIVTTQPRHQPRLASTEQHIAPIESVSDEDALALSEMLAPSKPAPPLPITHQERLLAEVVDRGAPEELSNLRPEVRARQMELSKAEFHDFFEPPPAKANE